LKPIGRCFFFLPPLESLFADFSVFLRKPPRIPLPPFGGPYLDVAFSHFCSSPFFARAARLRIFIGLRPSPPFSFRLFFYNPFLFVICAGISRLPLQHSLLLDHLRPFLPFLNFSCFLSGTNVKDLSPRHDWRFPKQPFFDLCNIPDPCTPTGLTNFASFRPFLLRIVHRIWRSSTSSPHL